MKYIKVEYPQYEKYETHPRLAEFGYDKRQDAYYIPEEIVDQVDYDDYPEIIEYDGKQYNTRYDWNRGDNILVEDNEGKRHIVTCLCKSKSTMPDIFSEEDNYTNGHPIPGINCWVVGIQIKE